MSNDYQLCILKDESEYREYEKGLFNGYKDDPGGWIYTHYKKINNQRLQSTLPYSDLVIYSCKKAGKIVAALTMNLNTHEMELKKMGFTIDAADKHISEGLSIFYDDSVKDELFALLVMLRNYMLDDIRARGIKYVYGTTSKKFLNFHLFVYDWEVLEIKKVGNEERCLLLGDVEKWFNNK